MNNLPDNISPDLIASYLSHQTGEDEAKMLEQWIAASPTNQQYFQQFKVVWEETGKLIPAPIDVDVDSAWNRMSMQMDAAEQIGNSTKSLKRTIPIQSYLLRIAAVLVPIVVIASITFWMIRPPKMLSQTTGQHSKIDTLSDGSVAYLNKYSKLTYPEKFKGNTREVEMEGEVFFGIHADKTKPFLIHAENTLIKVVGTSFNVKASKNSQEIEVVVESGIVVFSEIKANADTVSIRLIAGEKGIYQKKSHQLLKQKADDMNAYSWKSKTLVFNRTKLSKVISTLEEHYEVKINLKDRNLEEQHFSATFNNQHLDSILNVLSSTFELKCSKQGSDYVLERGN